MDKQMYVIVRENIGVVAAHNDFELIKSWRLGMEQSTKEHHFIFKEIEGD